MMMFGQRAIALACVFVGAAVADTNNKECRLYLGPSSLSSEDETRLGLFAGVEFNINDVLPIPEIAIPLVDFLEGPYSFIDEYKDILKTLEPNLWTAEYAGGAKFEGNYSSTVFVAGVGSLAQFHAAYSNIDWLQASSMLNFDPSLHPKGKAHPTRGTVSPYQNMTMRATQHIQVGMELFAAFGELYDDGASKQDLFEQKIIKSDYSMADQLADKLVQLLNHPDIMNDAELKEDTLDLVLERILPAAGGKRAKAIKSLIPGASRKLANVQQVGTFKYRHADTVKSTKWLKKNAVCVDTLVPGVSHNKDAGRGAFAARNFKQGDRVALSPLIPLYDDVLQMYDIVRKTSGDESWLEFTDNHRGQQLLMNYAYGHPQSPIMFLPTSPMVNLINHDSKEANVRMDWADHGTMFTNADLHGKTSQELREMDPQPHFVMQFTATRDIAAGDEILLDYGVDWEEAWNEYYAVNDWTIDWPLRAIDVQQTYLSEPYPVDIKHDAHPYPDGVMTACFLQTGDIEDGVPRTSPQGYKIYKWTGPTTYEDYQGHELVICDLVSRSGDDSDLSSLQYVVNARINHGDHDHKDIVQVKGVPHNAIVVVNRSYESDLHVKGVFRRWITIRDEIVPQAWRVRDFLASA